MARPTKQGIDYFPVDCQFDDKIEMYIIEKGATGYAVLMTIWQMMYSNEGYFVKANKDLHLLVKRKIDVDINEVSDCINICLERGIFDSSLYNAHKILTSKAVQKRFFEAAKKKKMVNVDRNYLCRGVDSYDNWVNVGENATNVEVEVKVNVKEEVKVNESKINVPNNHKFSGEDFALAEWMFEKILQVADKTKKPDLGKWAEVIRLMRERDKYSLDEIKKIFLWANADQFWSTNILSPDKLRKQFARLSALARQTPKVAAFAEYHAPRRKLSA